MFGTLARAKVEVSLFDALISYHVHKLAATMRNGQLLEPSLYGLDVSGCFLGEISCGPGIYWDDWVRSTPNRIWTIFLVNGG